MKAYVALDLEATSPNPKDEETEILEIAAQDMEGNLFHRYVATSKPLEADHEVFRLTGIPFGEYQREKEPPEVALRAFLDFLGERPLLGHNLLRYDLPLLEKALEKVGLHLPPTAKPALDTLRLAHLVLPTPPEGLSGYRLGDLHAYFTGEPHANAHRAQADVEATWRVLAGLMGRSLPGGVARAWRELGLEEGGLFPEKPGQVKELLTAPAQVVRVAYEGPPLPHPSHLGRDLLPTRRPAQEEMFAAVEEALARGKRLLLEAPTGTGKTKGYLYPVLHRGERTWVATHTKVLQAQALEELRAVGERGFGVKAALVKSPRDTLCPEALFELFLDARDEEDEELRAAVGVLLHYAALGGYDLEALPGYWHFSRGFREARDRVGTNPHRCRPECPFFQTCAFQKQLAHRREAQVLVANQAYLLSHFGQETPEGEAEAHLVVDEAHHLEDVATEALTQTLDQEELVHWLNRLAHPKKDKGLLKDRRRLSELSEEERQKAKEVAQDLLPRLRETLERYSRHLVEMLKNHGKGDPRYGLALGLSVYWKHLEEWPQVDREEWALLRGLWDLRGALRELAQEPRTLLARDLVPVREYLKGAVELLEERRRVLGLLEGDTDPNRLHLSEWDPLTQGWRHLAQPVDVARYLRDSLWPAFKGVLLTSATLSVPTEKDPEGFHLLKWTLGLEEAEARSLPPSLPYEKAHLLVPRHLPEAREATLPRFQRLFHQELRELLPRVHRSLTLFTSLKRMQDAKEALQDLPHLLVPLTRKEREDVASQVRRDPRAPVAALGSRSYMEGVDFPALKLVNLERIPFPLPSPLLKKREARAHEMGLDPWWDYSLPKAALAFAQAFGRLIRDGREEAGDGAFVLWDKKLLGAAYQSVFYRVLPQQAARYFPQDRKAFYDLLAKILGLDRALLPQEELEEEVLVRLREILQSSSHPLEKARRIAEEVYGLTLEEERWAKQAEAIQAALEGKDLLALLPTGFGKSLAFQIPALMGKGLTLVVSPLVALMKDQADRLLELGLPVGAVHSLMGAGEQRAVLEEVWAGRVRLLYVSPERLNRSEALWKLLKEKHAEGLLERVVFDEAHCLVEWGFDFRPDYLKALERLGALEGVPRSFFTATLTQEALETLKKAARLEAYQEVRPPTFHRPNLRFVVTKARGETVKFQVLAQAVHWLMERKGSGIVYVSTRAEAERLAWALGRLFPDLGVEAYHAGLGPVPRREAQERFMEGKTRVMVATTAFGMGVDKPDIRLVVHWRPPRSLEEYIQQAGRAGRDREEAYCLLLYTKGDWGFLRWMAGVGAGREEQDFADRLLELLRKEGSLVDYRRDLYERVSREEGGKVEEDAGEEDEGEEDEEEPPSTLRRELGLENLEAILAGLERAGALTYDYLPGKVFLLAQKELEAHLTPEEKTLLHKAGYQGKDRGDELNFSCLSPEEALRLDERLYALIRQDELGLYHYREPLLRLRPGPDLEGGYRRWKEEREKLKEAALERLKQVERYAEWSLCRTQTLLRHLEEEGEPCGACDLCTGDTGPWEGVDRLDPEELERAYRPLDVLLGFFAWAEENDYSKEGTYRYLGKRSTLRALRGQDRGKNATLGPKYTRNPLFAHLSFMPPKELEQAFRQALERGYLEVKDRYRGHEVYGLTEKGRRQVAIRRRKEAKSV
ncbi:ATP-binding protein [Thermus filiformis]|uniref:ATP-dependent DNA helicase RecQ n=1 Tax=Thermus filiformis TaxID=276 RepID=A0A0A2WMB5_THEFI|nr:ATP-binding protein [Thermus filiformis]